MYGEKVDLGEARVRARKAGAVSEGSWYVRSGYNTELFTVHFFNEEGDEVAIWHTSLDSYSEFTPPRVWHPTFKDELVVKSILED